MVSTMPATQPPVLSTVDSLRSAIQEVKEAKRTGRSFQTADDFLKEFFCSRL